jgi:outer membrane protein assembly factor BamB
MYYLTRLKCAAQLSVLLFTLAACALTGPTRPPMPLSEIKPTHAVRKLWTVNIGRTGRNFFQPVVLDQAVYAAAEKGVVFKLNAASGAVIWRTQLAAKLTAGVGSDGVHIAVGGAHGAVYLLDSNGKLQWQGAVESEIVTPPLVGQGLVLVRTINGRITAFDVASGQQQWVFQNRSMPLTLRTPVGIAFATQPGVVLAGFPGGLLAAINLSNGEPYWQTPVAYPAGVNEVERINDVVGAPAVIGDKVCAVTFQGRLGCFNQYTGQLLWEQPFSGYTGLAHDAEALVATDEQSFVSLYAIQDGRRLWQNTQLKNRNLGMPMLTDDMIIVGDYKGFIHFISRANGHFIARVKTDNSAIAAQPVGDRHTLIVQTHTGHLSAWQIE